MILPHLGRVSSFQNAEPQIPAKAASWSANGVDAYAPRRAEVGNHDLDDVDRRLVMADMRPGRRAKHAAIRVCVNQVTSARTQSLSYAHRDLSQSQHTRRARQH